MCNHLGIVGRKTLSESHMRDDLEHELTKRFRKTIWSPFLSAVKNYGMAMPGDRIAVCLSGGKDSLLMAKCMQTLKKYSKVPFELVYLCMDPGYDPHSLDIMKIAASRLGIQPDMFKTDIYQVVEGMVGSPCHVCAAMRRGYLYKEAQKRGCNKIALGHHRDDAAETILLSVLYGGQFKAMLPRLKSENYKNMELIRPLYLVREKAVRAWLTSAGITAITCACRVTRSADGGKRLRVKRLIHDLETEQPNVVDNIIASSEQLICHLLSYKLNQNSPVTSFMQSFATSGTSDVMNVDKLF